ncbi:MAG: SCO family protein [Pseudomonadales bacterium]|nr:SCO family protein [Pseudomonadales bacterium]
MQNRIWKRAAVMGLTLLCVSTASILFALLHHEDGNRWIAFNLTDHNGVPRSELDFNGEYLLTFFGFTSCPAVCPTQMANISKAMELLERKGIDRRVTPVFISVDSVRDDPATVQRYLQRFHPSFVGLTGTRRAIEAAADSFSAVFSATETRPDLAAYEVSHSSFMYLVGPDGRIVDFIPPSTPAEIIADRIGGAL